MPELPLSSPAPSVPAGLLLQVGGLSLGALLLGLAAWRGAPPATTVIAGTGICAAASLGLASLWTTGLRARRRRRALLGVEAATLAVLAVLPTGLPAAALATAAAAPLLALRDRPVALGLVPALGLAQAAVALGIAGSPAAEALPLVGASMLAWAALVALGTAAQGPGSVLGLSRTLHLRNRQLAAANASLLEQNDALDAFNAAVSHDLRSPLTALRLSLECAAEDAPGDDTRAAVSDALAATVRMEQMVRELLALSRAGKTLVDTAPVALHTPVSQAIDQLKAEIESRGALVELRGPLPEARGSAPLLAQVAQNLIENALKYGNPHGPPVRVIGGRLGDETWLEVEDNGEGVPEGDRARIFAPFVQLSAAQEGVGTGLALTQRIVAAHGGRIHVSRSAHLGGACFRVFLPAAGAPALTVRTGDPTEPAAASPSARGIVLPFPGPDRSAAPARAAQASVGTV